MAEVDDRQHRDEARDQQREGEPPPPEADEQADAASHQIKSTTNGRARRIASFTSGEGSAGMEHEVLAVVAVDAETSAVRPAAALSGKTNSAGLLDIDVHSLQRRAWEERLHTHGLLQGLSRGCSPALFVFPDSARRA